MTNITTLNFKASIGRMATTSSTSSNTRRSPSNPFNLERNPNATYNEPQPAPKQNILNIPRSENASYVDAQPRQTTPAPTTSTPRRSGGGGSSAPKPVTVETSRGGGINVISGGTVEQQQQVAQTITQAQRSGESKTSSYLRGVDTAAAINSQTQAPEKIHQLGVKNEVIGETSTGGFILKQRNPYTGEESFSNIAEVPASFSDNQKRYETDRSKPFVSNKLMTYEQPIGSGEDNSTFVAVETGEVFKRNKRGFLSTNRLDELNQIQEYDLNLFSNPAGSSQQFGKLPKIENDNLLMTAIRIPQNALLNTRTKLGLGSSREFATNPLALESERIAGRQFQEQAGIGEQLPILSGFGVRVGLTKTYGGEILQSNGTSVPNYNYKFGFLTTPSEAKTSALQRFEAEFISRGGNPLLAQQLGTEFGKRITSANEAAMLAVGGSAEIIGRAGVVALTRGAQLTLSQSAWRIGGATAAAGAFEGSVGSALSESQYGDVTFAQTAKNALLGAATAGTISVAQFGLDVTQTATRKGYNKTFNALVNIADLQEPVSDVLASEVQRRARRFPIKTFVSEPTVTFNPNVSAKKNTFAFSSVIVGAETPVIVSPKTRSKEFTFPVAIDTRVRTTPKVNTKTRTPISINPFSFTSTKTDPFIAPQVQPRANTKTTTKTNVEVFTPRFDVPILPLGFGGGRQKSGGRTRMIGRGQSGSLAGSILGSFGVKLQSRDFLTGVGVR